MFKLVVLSCVLASAAAGALLAPISPLAYTAPIASFAYSPPLLTPSNYRGPLSLAPGQPANILAADGRPLDTLDVNLDRSAHFTAKALNGVHFLKKRSLVAPFGGVAVAHTAPILTHAAPLTYSTPLLVASRIAAPLAYSAPIVRYY